MDFFSTICSAIANTPIHNFNSCKYIACNGHKYHSFYCCIAVVEGPFTPYAILTTLHLAVNSPNTTRSIKWILLNQFIP